MESMVGKIWISLLNLKMFFMKDLLHQMVCVAMILHPCNKMSVVLILSINSMNGKIFALPCRYCYCCWQEDPKKQQFLVFAASDKRMETNKTKANYRFILYFISIS